MRPPPFTRADNPPKYGSDLNLWPAIYTELAKRELLDEWLSKLDALTAIWPESIQPILHLQWREAILIAATPEERLRALCAVLDEIKR